MSAEFGKLFTCDRCGRKIFCEEIDGHVCKDLIEGWGSVRPTNVELKHLCPPCNKEYIKIIDKFFEKEPKSEDLPGWAK